MNSELTDDQEYNGHQIDREEYFDIPKKMFRELAKDIEPSFKLCHLPIDKERAEKDMSYLAQVTLAIFKDANRPMDEHSIQERVVLIGAWEHKLGKGFVNTADFLNKLGKTARGVSKIPDDARKLKRERRKMKWTQEQLARHLETSRSSITAMETGERELSKKAQKWIEHK